jgi:hypothetical protein
MNKTAFFIYNNLSLLMHWYCSGTSWSAAMANATSMFSTARLPEQHAARRVHVKRLRRPETCQLLQDEEV